MEHADQFLRDSACESGGGGGCDGGGGGGGGGWRNDHEGRRFEER